MSLDMFSSSSESKQRTINRQIAASDQALVYQVGDRSRVDSPNLTNRVARGGTLTINTGFTADEVNNLAQSLTNQASVNPSFSDDGAFKEALLISLNQRAAANTNRATDEATAAAPSSVRKWVGYAVAVVVVIALAVLFGGKKKS